MVETGPAQRKLAAILAADVVGYSWLMGRMRKARCGG
jgi:class 3 adenylate cyclase